MSTVRLSLLPAIPTILLSLLLARSPFMMATTEPSGVTPWADGPLALVPTPQYEMKKVGLAR